MNLNNWNSSSLYDYYLNKLPKGWEEFFESNKSLLFEISEKLKTKKNITPNLDEIFKIFYMITPQDIKVIILGQDPYPDGNGNGIPFMVKNNTKINKSLQNIYNVVRISGFNVKNDEKSLILWINQGVFLINSYFTVELNNIGSHEEIWKKFTSILIKYVNSFKEKKKDRRRKVFIGFGSIANNIIKENVSNQIHFIRRMDHPAKPNFIAKPILVDVNKDLEKISETPINWNL